MKKYRKRRFNGYGVPITCTTSFDFVGWEAWGNWRRSATGTLITDHGRDLKLLDGTYDDCLHCDYPSQCRQRMSQLQIHTRRGLYRIEEYQFASDGGKRSSNSPSMALSRDDNLVMNEPTKLDCPPNSIGKPRSPAVDASNMSEEQLFGYLEEDDDMMPLEYRPTTNGLRVRNHCEQDWEDSSSESGSDDDEVLVDSNGNFLQSHNKTSADEGSLASLIKANNAWLRGDQSFHF
ncbi:hypothetical protein JX265_012191 [Neoarthrinium moseri]|uniref:Uncharacterized protein n=1 Tax=Neoarthrinium moseri TaxID=1658444 RepID=A0A9P9WB38_9PEZI|nr:hypothetical protein JX266_010589 [Neoarthrinium moseri]KAI1855746.1 hypothetical protein JX265_012191 [Neoarthrinium moseri]